jgi:hypothetical protein
MVLAALAVRLRRIAAVVAQAAAGSVAVLVAHLSAALADKPMTGQRAALAARQAL